MLRAPTWHVSDRDHYTLIRRPASGLPHEASRPREDPHWGVQVAPALRGGRAERHDL